MTAGWVGQTAAEDLDGPRAWTLHSLFDFAANLELDGPGPSPAMVHIGVRGIRAPFGIEIADAEWRRLHAALSAASARPAAGRWDAARGAFSGDASLVLGHDWRRATGDSSIEAVVRSPEAPVSIGVGPLTAAMASGITRVAPAGEVLQTAGSLVDALVEGGADASTRVALDGPMSWLLGRGPGLTPSGDDVMIGILGALHRFSHPGRSRDGIRVLSGMLAEKAAASTTAVSRAYLAAACRGRFAAPIRRVLLALGDADAAASGELAEAVRTLRRIGHTSGADTLVGLAVALERLGGRSRQAVETRIA